MHRDQEYDRDERRDVRRGERMDEAPRERYGNEEDAYSREYRRAYPEQQLERRLHDDAPYNRPGYEPEMGRPGGRENVDLDRTRGPERRGRGNRGEYGDRGQAGQPSQRHAFETSGEDWTDDGGQEFPGQGGYYGQGQRSGERPGYGQRFEQRRGQRVWQSGYSSGRQTNPQASPYDYGDVGSWYGGDTGMGDTGSSLDRPDYGDEYGNQSRSQYGNPFSGRQFRGGQYGGQRGGGQYGGGMGRGQRQSTGDFEQGDFGMAGFGLGSFAHGGQGQARRGPFTGRGPRGYQRSDERIREDVCELLTAHGEIDASSMEVDVRQGTVILRGTADSGRVRRLTEGTIEEIPGVRDVENQLRVNQRTGYSEQFGGTGQQDGGRQQRSQQQGGQWQGEEGQRSQRPGSQQLSGGTGAAQTTPAYGTGVAETSGVSTRSGPGEPGMSAGAGPSQHGNRWQIRETMDVIGSDGESVGEAKSVRGTDFLVNRPRERDLYVPFSAVQTVDSERVMLSCRASEVDEQNWPAASLTGGA